MLLIIGNLLVNYFGIKVYIKTPFLAFDFIKKGAMNYIKFESAIVWEIWGRRKRIVTILFEIFLE